MNHPMQGSAADIIKLAMIEVSRRLREEGFAAKLLIQVHDELDFSVPEGGDRGAVGHRERRDGAHRGSARASRRRRLLCR